MNSVPFQNPTGGTVDFASAVGGGTMDYVKSIPSQSNATFGLAIQVNSVKGGSIDYAAIVNSVNGGTIGNFTQAVLDQIATTILMGSLGKFASRGNFSDWIQLIGAALFGSASSGTFGGTGTVIIRNPENGSSFGMMLYTGDAPVRERSKMSWWS